MTDIRKRQNSDPVDQLTNLTDDGVRDIATALAPAFLGLEQTSLLKMINDAVPEFVDNLDYLAPYSGAIQRTLSAKLGDTVSVTDFGAVGDGVTDDTAAFTAAAASASEVIVPSGDYVLSEHVEGGFIPQYGVSYPSVGIARPAERGFFTDSSTGANVLRFRDRVFIGDGTSDRYAALRNEATSSTEPR